MPEATTRRRVRQKRSRGASASSQAGEFVREEMRHKRSKKHGSMSRKQAIAIGLSKARRSGIRVPAKRRGNTRRTTERQYRTAA